MSAEQLPNTHSTYTRYEDYADEFFYAELVRRQNEDLLTAQVIFLSGSFQKLYAESLIAHLQSKPYLQKFGGKAVSLVMTPTEEHYMFNIGLQIID